MSQFEPFDFYLLRMPVLPYNHILKALNRANDLTNEFAEIIHQPLFQEAIFLASAELHAEMQKWLNETSTEKKEKISTTIYKYLLRMATRSTPYGLFAGCALGKIVSIPTDINLMDKTIHKTYRLDTGCYAALADEIPFLNDDILKETIFLPNTSIYKVGETYRYYEYKIIEEKRSYFLSSFSQNKYIDKLLAGRKNGISFNNLIICLKEMDVPEEESFEYLKTLITNQILVSEYAPKLTGGNQLEELITALENKQIPETDILKTLVDLKQILGSNEDNISKYSAATKVIKGFIPTIKQKDRLQVDIVFNIKNNFINTVPINEIVKQLEKLLPFNTATKSNDLERFKNAFYQKFEDREIALLEAIDNDLGVGYGKIMGEETFYTPLIDDLIMPTQFDDNKRKWTDYEAFILDKFVQYQQNKSGQINITDEDIAMLSQQIVQENKQKVSATFAALGSIYATSQTDFDQLNFSFLLKNCGSNSAISLMSRFGSEQKEIANALHEVVEYEKEIVPDKLLAEIIHLPEGRVGNVLVRPQIFDYEIPFLGTASVNENFTITVDDLFVAVKNGQLVLRSKRLNKEILPRLTNAHNFSTGLPVYKFLCDLQFQNEGLSIDWNWGILDKQSFLPRVVYKNIILKRRRWLIAANKYKSNDTDEKIIMAQFKNDHQLPDLVLLAEGDNELLLDINNKISRSILTSKIGKTDIVLYEYLHQAGEAFLASTDGFYDNEIIIPIKNKNFIPLPANKYLSNISQKNNDFFTVGSEWLYLKIYSGYKSIDTILMEIIIPLITEFVNKDTINQWFFVRYQDPESHLRIRFNVKDSSDIYELIKYINKKTAEYIENRIIQKLEYATYFKETEKYTPWAIDLCEYVFYMDSQTVLNIVYLIQQTKDEESRWLIAIKGVDALLVDFNYSLAGKKEFIESCFVSFFKEFNGDKQLMVQLNDKFRRKKLLINDLFNKDGDKLPEEIHLFLQQRSKENIKVYAELLKRIERENAGSTIVNKLVNNFVHLYLNRLFVANHRLHEMVVYHHLLKYYESALARVGNKE